MRRVEAEGRTFYKVDRRAHRALVRAGRELVFVAVASIAGAGAIALGLQALGVI